MCKISISSYLRKAVCQTLREDVIYKSNKTNNKFPPKSPDYEETILVVFRKIFESLNKWQAGIPVMMSKETDTSRLSAFTKGNFSCKPDKKILDNPKNKTTRREKVFFAINRDVLSLQKRGRQLCVRKWPEAGTPVPRQVLQAS